MQILADIAHHDIKIFQAPVYDNEDEETLAENEEITVRPPIPFLFPSHLLTTNRKAVTLTRGFFLVGVCVQSKIPFAIVGSDSLIPTPSGKTVRGRSYPWGIVEVDNEDHCDFVKLRQMLIRTHMEELREVTQEVLYERYREEKLLGMGVSQDDTVFKEIKCVLPPPLPLPSRARRLTPVLLVYAVVRSPAAKMAEERSLHEAKLTKMEAEMKMVFQQKVQEKEAKLKQSEEELYARHREMKDALEKQRVELEDKKRRVEQGRPLTPEKSSVRFYPLLSLSLPCSLPSARN